MYTYKIYTQDKKELILIINNVSYIEILNNDNKVSAIVTYRKKIKTEKYIIEDFPLDDFKKFIKDNKIEKLRAFNQFFINLEKLIAIEADNNNIEISNDLTNTKYIKICMIFDIDYINIKTPLIYWNNWKNITFK